MSIFSKNYMKNVYTPKHPEKCLNTNGKLSKQEEPTYRSSWELRFMNFCDLVNSVLEWGSEIITIPYINEVDGKQHRYTPDFYFICKDANNNINKYILEVKPKSQVANLNENGELIYPNPPKRKTQVALSNWQERCNAIRMNNSKWKYARKWCKENGFIFKVLTEEEIGIQW